MLEEIYPKIVFKIAGIPITDTVVTTWLLIVFLGILSAIIASRLRYKPGPVQHVVEYFVESIYALIKNMIGRDPSIFFPLIAGLALFIGSANLIGLIPGLHPPTQDINTPLALALVVFFSVPYFGIRVLGIKEYAHHYFSPIFFLFPVHVVSELTRTVSLTFRLFGNIMGEEVVIAVLFLLSPLFLPVPMLIFSIFTGIIQSFIFTILTLVYISGAVQAGPAHQEERR